jgi:hypothetical protein
MEEPSVSMGATETRPNRNTRRRKSQELQKARQQKKRDERTGGNPPRLTEEDIPRLRERWVTECRKSFESQPLSTVQTFTDRRILKASICA